MLCPEPSGQKATGLFLSLFPELPLQLHTETGSFLVSVQELDSGPHVCKAKYLHYLLSHGSDPGLFLKMLSKELSGKLQVSPREKELHCLGPSRWGDGSVSQVLPTQA